LTGGFPIPAVLQRFDPFAAALIEVAAFKIDCS
jgi:hypothetical protein